MFDQAETFELALNQTQQKKKFKLYLDPKLD
jgi:hypothetical protein